jgi:hypothetical protein
MFAELELSDFGGASLSTSIKSHTTLDRDHIQVSP